MNSFENHGVRGDAKGYGAPKGLPGHKDVALSDPHVRHAVERIESVREAFPQSPLDERRGAERRLAKERVTRAREFGATAAPAAASGANKFRALAPGC
jgi:hypothetical protein